MPQVIDKQLYVHRPLYMYIYIYVYIYTYKRMHMTPPRRLHERGDLGSGPWIEPVHCKVWVGTPLQSKPESWNMTILQLQLLAKRGSPYDSCYIHVPNSKGNGLDLDLHRSRHSMNPGPDVGLLDRVSPTNSIVLTCTYIYLHMYMYII